LNRVVRYFILAGCIAFGVGVGSAMLQLSESPARLTGDVMTNLPDSGVEHPVTAVLLNFRGYDTLLEVAVLLLALLGVLATTDTERSDGRRLTAAPQPVLQSLVRLLAPMMVLMAGYLLWAGAHQPGGAFQAGAVLASSVVLFYLAGLLPAWESPGGMLRAGLGSGLLVFIAVAALPLGNRALLEYPRQLAGLWILLIEASLTVSLGLVLAGLFLWLSDENEEAES
jgi:multisubunit Na+/H+ antiporter MnhB subunit